MEPEERSRFRWSMVAGAAVVLLLFGSVFLLTRRAKGPGAVVERRLPFGAAEQAYAVHIHFLNLQMSRASNFLNQQITYVDGEISNDGVRTIREVELTLEFRDPFNQVVLRESRWLLGRRARPLEGGQRRDFEIALEHIPAEWNQQYPSIRVTSLDLE